VSLIPGLYDQDNAGFRRATYPIWTGVGRIRRFASVGGEPPAPAKEVFQFERDWAHLG
jgi:hypothetical protein